MQYQQIRCLLLMIVVQCLTGTILYAGDSTASPVAFKAITYEPRFAKAASPKFWVVNFGTSSTLAPGKIGFAAGMGGQMVFVGSPRKTNAFFMIPHAGFRIGIAKQLDGGLRMAPVPLPYSSAGPSFGINFDLKYCLTPAGKKTQFAVDAGIGISHVVIQETTRFAWSYNAALLNTYTISKSTAFTIMARYVNIQIPTAPKGSKENFVNIGGTSFGLRKNINDRISLLPEVGLYWYEGQLLGVKTSGPGFQYGFMVATSF